MDNSHQQLRGNLEKLRGQIDQTTPADPETQQRLQSLKQHVDGALAQPVQGQPHPYHSLRERLSDNVEHFQTRHAELALSIDQVLSNLAAIGL